MQQEKSNNSGIWNSAEEKLVLASKSAARGRLLEQAGIPFERDPAIIDERGLEAAFIGSGGSLEGLALMLAQAKAIDVSHRHPGVLCLGADQVLVLAGGFIHKAETIVDAVRNLQRLSGRAHLLVSAFAIARDALVACEGLDSAKMTVRLLHERQIALYLRLAGSSVLESVGGYLLEGVGIHIFEKIEGDNSSILGLPMLGVLSALRGQSALLL